MASRLSVTVGTFDDRPDAVWGRDDVRGRFSGTWAGPEAVLLAKVPVSRWGVTGVQPGDFVMNGNANPWNYLMSGKH